MWINGKKTKQRRGRVVDEKFKEFARSQGCILRNRHTCDGPVEFHHVRFCGSPKDDTRGFGLCAKGHEIVWNSRTSIHALGKTKWEYQWNLSIECVIANLRKLYQQQKGRAA